MSLVIEDKKKPFWSLSTLISMLGWEIFIIGVTSLGGALTLYDLRQNTLLYPTLNKFFNDYAPAVFLSGVIITVPLLISWCLSKKMALSNNWFLFYLNISLIVFFRSILSTLIIIVFFVGNEMGVSRLDLLSAELPLEVYQAFKIGIIAVLSWQVIILLLSIVNGLVWIWRGSVFARKF